MLISHTHRFIFIHIPKTGGKSITRVLVPYLYFDFEQSSTWEREYISTIAPHLVVSPAKHRVSQEGLPPGFSRLHDHSTASEAKRSLPADIFGKYFKFAFVRNPFDWLVSVFFFFSQKEDEEYFPFFSQFPDFNEFIGFLVDKSKFGFSDLNFMGLNLNSPQKDSVYDANGRLLVDCVGRFETLGMDFDRICSRIGIGRTELPHINKSGRENYLKYYTLETRKQVFKILKEDFITFGYPH